VPGTLADDGSYRLTIDPAGGAAGWLKARLRVVDDVQSTLTPGRPVAVRITQPGQNARVTFTVPEGTQLTWAADRSTFDSALLGLDGPYGSIAAAMTSHRAGGGERVAGRVRGKALIGVVIPVV